jgi:hypothetical protein
MKIKYLGEISTATKTTGCASCGTLRTIGETTRVYYKERVLPSGQKQMFIVGGTYEENGQDLDYLLNITYKNEVGEVVHAFQEIK